MTDYLAAIDRDVGRVDTDSGGLARYSFKLQIPSGIKSGNEPELSLEYCQGCPNGSLGIGWAIGGLSCIRLAASNLAFDGKNNPPAEYDRFQPKFTLDGVELLNIKGIYGTKDAIYTTELDTLGRQVVPYGTGFIVSDSMGRKMEYGTTKDSCVVSVGGSIQEWRLKRQMDCHDNAVIYNYVISPNQDANDVNTSYLSSIQYCTNTKYDNPDSRIINMEYSTRPDVVVQTVQGYKACWAQRLTAIRIGVIRNESVKIYRSYELAYSLSPSTGDSCLTSITEVTQTERLLPTTFAYTTPDAQTDLFKTQEVVNLRQSTGNIALFTMNISGRALADVACVRYNTSNKSMSLKTYLAKRNINGTVTWAASSGNGFEATLPFIDITQGFPSILSPDMNSDGRADIVVPYKDGDGFIRFSISQSVGTGFQPGRTKVTKFPWTESKFMALDLDGRGSTDIIQIFTDRQKLTFRHFPGITRNGEFGLLDAVTTRTTYDNSMTIDWISISNPKTGAKSLIRVWSKETGTGKSQVLSTAFVITNAEDPNSGFEEGRTSVLGAPIRLTGKPSVLVCDINGDGTQDIVLAVAEYTNGRMVLTSSIYLGDGVGGFELHGQNIQREVTTTLPPLEVGKFHMTNLNGSNYPSLSYVYRDVKGYICVSVDGKSDGMVGKAILHRLIADLPFKNGELIPIDLNGNGMGDWLYYTIENDQPRMLPIYNQAHVTDFLAWAEDPMGLRTKITYGTLSDPAVYQSSADWENYKRGENNYPVLAAPNYVVTALEHQNNPLVNSLEYRVSIKKSYGSALVNTRGRGWQGFGHIDTLNKTNGVLTTETYFQEWPLTGLKSHIETKTPDGTLLRREQSIHEDTSVAKGPWKIYQTHKSSEQLDMIENGKTVRSNVTSYVYDANGNIVVKSQFETQQGQLMHQSWERCSYDSIKGITGLMTRKKLSSKPNTDLTTFQKGDLSLSVMEYDPMQATLKTLSEWSSDANAFATTSFVFDGYGNEIESVNAAGLTIKTIYDKQFNTYPIKVIETGSGVSTVRLTAYDEASGNEIAKLDNNSLSCYRLDGFGRTVETRHSGSGELAVSASSFLADRPFATDEMLSQIIANSSLLPARNIAFERQKGSSGAPFLIAKAYSYSGKGMEGRREIVEALDCARQVRKRSSRDGNDSQYKWIGWKYTASGQQQFESYPIYAGADLDWEPNSSPGSFSKYDLLDRQIQQIIPNHENQFTLTSTAYLDGGAQVQEQKFVLKDINSSPLDPISTVRKQYMRIGQQEYILKSTDENELTSSFLYDVSGNMIKSSDPAGQMELREYNSRGNLISIQGSYTMLYQYNLANQLISEKNAAGEIVTYQRDPKGRITEKIGADGRTIAYLYEHENLRSVILYPQSSKSTFETRYDFTYDEQGRPLERAVTLADGTRYATKLAYNWLGGLVKKTLPDGAVIVHDYRGELHHSTTITSGSSSTWKLTAEISQFNAYEKPETLKLRGTDLHNEFINNWAYDTAGFPTRHTLGTDDQLFVDEHYAYNNLDQMVRKHEFLTGSTIDYLYKGRRLASSQSGDATNKYFYDDSGNLISKGGMNINYNKSQVTGTRDDVSVFDLIYDQAGRPVKRTIQGTSMDFKYDSFGSLQSWTSGLLQTQILADHEGETLLKKNADGSSELTISPEFSIYIASDGSRTARHTLYHAGQILGVVSNTYESETAKRPLSGGRGTNIHFTDTKGSLTHIFDGEDGKLREKLSYDDFGLINGTSESRTNTFEGKCFDGQSGLLDFGSRWYDPFLGRFMTPDNIINVDLLIRPDGLNRYAFENNDPINYIDPTGHWSLSSIGGALLSGIAIVAAVGITVATGGAAAPLVAAGVGALMGGGIAGLSYSIKHRDEENAGKFWAGFGTTVAINATIGALTGAAGAALAPARAISATGRLAAKVGLELTNTAVKTIGTIASVGSAALFGGAASVATTAASRQVENVFYGGNKDIFEGAGTTFLYGALAGAFLGGLSAKSALSSRGAPPPSTFSKASEPFKLTVQKTLAPSTNHPIMQLPGLTKMIIKSDTAQYLTQMAKLAGKPAAKAVWGVYKGSIQN